MQEISDSEMGEPVKNPQTEFELVKVGSAKVMLDGTDGCEALAEEDPMEEIQLLDSAPPSAPNPTRTR